MSWAAHNPEKYDEICRKGIAAKVQKAMAAQGYDDADLEELEAVALSIQEDPDGDKAYTALLDWSVAEVSAEEQDYFGNLADQAYERGKP